MNGKFTGILLLFCLIAPVASTFTCLYVQKIQTKKAIKQRMAAGIDQKSLVFWQFSLAEFRSKLRWEHAHEFEYQGKMYDVVEMKTLGDSIALWCWPDHEESRLNQQLNELLLHALDKNPAHKAHQKKLFRFLESLFCPEIDIWRLPDTSIASPLVAFLLHRYFSLHFPPPIPPPKTA